ncbi:simple sugar transport system ATP-binding protein [Kribbella sp. VKM Ac-2527]|uniref:Simple sugar transport system ATP-binding protein n=1 Tax=Kribbella caucasensis TaxID=2512215 RepID=A0A4R6KMG5_9ACTN|nr:simple sugar transport system ATP-binding protein [Kribbella sp. VKM Ac-2527]
MTASSPRVPLLEARGITKHFGGVEALRGADFTVFENEVVALIGDNGAGKSTLVKILSGAQPPTSGQILVEGVETKLRSATDARAAGIETVFQDLALAPQLDAVANLYLGRELQTRNRIFRAFGWLDHKAMRTNAEAVLTDLGVKIKDIRKPISALSGGQRQGVAVARAVNWSSKVVFMDEPTAALGVVQTRQVLDTIRRVRDSGKSVVLVSHNMDDILAVADRIEVLRLGQRVRVFTSAEATLNGLVAAMTGAPVTEGVK